MVIAEMGTGMGKPYFAGTGTIACKYADFGYISVTILYLLSKIHAYKSQGGCKWNYNYT